MTKKMNNDKTKMSSCTNVHWMYAAYIHKLITKGMSNGYPMDVRLNS